MNTTKKYTSEELVNNFLRLEKQLGRQPRVNEFKIYGLPDINYYNRAYGNYAKFLQSLGREVKINPRHKKENPKRFFYPKEWNNFISTVDNEDYKFAFEGLLSTGARYHELEEIKVEDIDFDRECITLLKGQAGKTGKSNQRTIQISTLFKNKLQNYLRRKKITTGSIQIPQIATLDYAIKAYVRKSGIKDFMDFSVHNIRKTTENWLLALNIPTMSIVAHMGHKIDVAQAFYVSANLFNSEDKVLIRSILDNLLSK